MILQRILVMVCLMTLLLIYVSLGQDLSEAKNKSINIKEVSFMVFGSKGELIKEKIFKTNFKFKNNNNFVILLRTTNSEVPTHLINTFNITTTSFVEDHNLIETKDDVETTVSFQDDKKVEFIDEVIKDGIRSASEETIRLLSSSCENDEDIKLRAEEIEERVVNMEINLKSKLIFDNFYRTFSIDGCMIVCVYTYEEEKVSIKCRVKQEKLGINGLRDTTNEEVENWKPSEIIRGRKKRSLDLWQDTELTLLDTMKIKTVIGNKRNKLEGTKINKNEIVNIFKSIKYRCNSTNIDKKALSATCVKMFITDESADGCISTIICKEGETIGHLAGTCKKNECVEDFIYIVLTRTYSNVIINNVVTTTPLSNYIQGKFCEIKYGLKRVFTSTQSDCYDNKNKIVTTHLYRITIHNLVFYLDRINIRTIQNPKDIRFYNCSCSTCNGDDTYKSNFLYNETSETFCSFQTKSVLYGMHWDDLEYEISSFDVIEASVIFRKQRKGLLEKLDSSVVKPTCRNGYVYHNMKNNKLGDLTFEIDNDYSTYYIKKNSTSQETKLPTSFIGSKTIKLKVMAGTQETILEENLECSDMDTCSSMNCSMCVERWIYAHCFGPVEWVFYIIGFTAALGILLLLIMSIVAMLTIIYKYSLPIQNLCSYLIRKCHIGVKRKTKLAGKKYMELQELRIDEDEKQELMWDDTNLKSTKFKSGTYKSKYPTPIIFSVLLFLFLLPIAISQTCTDVTTLMTKVDSCSQLNSTYCSLSSEVLIKLSHKGEMACLKIKDNGEIITEIQIKIVKNTLYCVKNSLYWTASSESNCISHKNCDKAGDCSTDFCSSIKKSTTIPLWKELDSRLGSNYCASSCGCLGCGCFYCADGCLFYRNYFHPTGATYETFNCNQFVFMTEIVVNEKTKTNSKETALKLSESSTKTLNKMDFTIMSVSKPSIELSECFIRNMNHNQVSMVSCNRRDELIKGKVGEIQCPSKADADQLTSKCFYNSDLITNQLFDDRVSCSSTQINIDKLYENNKLPLIQTYGIIKQDDNNVLIEVESDMIVDLNIEFKNYDVQIIRDKIDCKANFLSLDGCYDCNKGSVITLEVWTDNLSTLGTLNCPKSKTTFTNLITSKKEKLEFRMAFDNANINDECLLTCSGGDFKIDIKGVLEYIPPSNPADDQEHTTDGDKSNSFDIKSIFSSDWFTSILAIIIILGIIFAIYKIYESGICHKIIRKKNKNS